MCFSLHSPCQPPVSWHSLAQGQMNAAEGVRVLFVTTCSQPCPLVHTEFLWLHCPSLAAAPAGMYLPAKGNPAGMQSWQTALVTGSALCSCDGNLQDPAPQRDSLCPGAAEQPGLVDAHLLSAQNDSNVH